MRIGIMLRSLDEKGGIGVYTRNITKELLELDRDNQYVLFYRVPSNIGSFSGYEQVVERVIQAPHKALWDQLAIPAACRKEKIDILFHPKFSVPLLAPCKTAMVLHGAGWFMPEFQGYWSKWDIRYARITMPIYCRKASAVISVSQLTTDTFNRVFHLPTNKITTVYFAPGRHFKRISDVHVLERVRAKYDLPSKFIFTLSSYDRGERKNIRGILNAYKMHHGKTAHSLVIGGKDCHKFKVDYGMSGNGFWSDIVLPGWIDQADLPAVYSMADAFLYPSNVEAFPIPITEALSCGTPIITSNSNGLLEIVGDAALLVTPGDHEEIARAIGLLLSNPELQGAISEKGLRRATLFSWDKCARQTLDIIRG